MSLISVSNFNMYFKSLLLQPKGQCSGFKVGANLGFQAKCFCFQITEPTKKGICVQCNYRPGTTLESDQPSIKSSFADRCTNHICIPGESEKTWGVCRTVASH